MDHDRYSGIDRADRWGCIAAMIIGLPIFGFLLVADAIGDCNPAQMCRKGFLLMVLLPTVCVAAPAALIVRALVKRFRREP